MRHSPYALALAFTLLVLAPNSTLSASGARHVGQRARIEYGSADELKGVSSVFIDTGADLKLHDRIAKEITKELPDLKVAASADDAEVILVYSADVSTYYYGSHSSGTINAQTTATTTGSTTTGTTTGTVRGESHPLVKTVKYGDGAVFKPVAGGVRLLMDYSGSKQGLLQKDPSVKFARAFVKAYRKANGLGDK